MRHITGTLVRQIGLMGGDVSKFVAPAVARKLKVKAAQRQSLKRRAGSASDGPRCSFGGLKP